MNKQWKCCSHIDNGAHFVHTHTSCHTLKLILSSTHTYTHTPTHTHTLSLSLSLNHVFSTTKNIQAKRHFKSLYMSTLHYIQLTLMYSMHQGVTERRGQAALLAQHPVHCGEGCGEDRPQPPLLSWSAQPQHPGPQVSVTSCLQCI